MFNGTNYALLVDEALMSFRLDSSYATSVLQQASVIQRKRDSWQQKAQRALQTVESLVDLTEKPVATEDLGLLQSTA